MMKPWEFMIKEPKDLGILADLLAEWGHPGASVCKSLFLDKRFPKLTKSESRYHPLKGWKWFMGVNTQKDLGKNTVAHSIPKESFNTHDSQIFFFTATEAVWAVINAGKYRSSKEIESA